MHRKIKERERQQWKDETKKKILLRQQELYREVLQEHNVENMRFNNVTESTISSESSTFHDDSSYKVVTVKIRCIPKDKENTDTENATGRMKKTVGSSKTHTSWAEEFRQNSLRYDDHGYDTSSSTSVDDSHTRSNNHSAGASTDSTKYISLEKPRSGEARSENLKQSNLPPLKSPTRSKTSNSRQTLRSESLKRSQSVEERSDGGPTNPPPSRSSVQSRPKSCKTIRERLEVKEMLFRQVFLLLFDTCNSYYNYFTSPLSRSHKAVEAPARVPQVFYEYEIRPSRALSKV